VLAASLAPLAAVTSAAAAPVVSPAPGTLTAMPQSQISFLGASASSLSSISVTGSASGRHRGRLLSYSSATGASFRPSRPFKPGEHVTVHARWRSPGGRLETVSTSFRIATPVAVSQAELAPTPGSPSDVQSFHSLPDLHPPVVTVHQPAGAASAPGLIFAAPLLGAAQSGPMIFDQSGRLVWFHPLPAGQQAADLRTQSFRGKDDLTWWQGRMLQLGYGVGEDVVANANYKTVTVVRAGNGLQADGHDFDVTSGGVAWILAYSPVRASLAAAGGPADGIAVEGVIQEIDVHTGLVMWEWHSLGHVGVQESYSGTPADTSTPYDYFHIDSLQVDAHGNILISARNTSGLYYLDGRSGAVIWRLGGKRSSFTLGPGVAFANQHDATLLKGGDISLLDDGVAPPMTTLPRGEIVKLDRGERTARLAGSLVRPILPATTTGSGSGTGDVQSLPGKGWMVGWGERPSFTEFDPHGRVLYDAQLAAGEISYGVFRLPWSAQPSEPPILSEITTGAASTVYASWNGATTATSWRLLTGSDPGHMAAVSTTPWGGFETAIPAPSAPLYAVQALSASGRVLGTSKAIPAAVR
jgi:hypothetical protein